MKNHAFILALVIPSLALAQSVMDPNLRVQTYLSGLSSPTGAVFLGNTQDALITQKNDGRVLLMRNRQIVGTVLDLPVANDSERGLLGITNSPTFETDKLVYLYHTVASADGGTAIVNRVSRYVWNGTNLVFNRNVLELPGGPGPNHDGGKMVFDSKGKLMVVIGDLNRNEQTSNFQNSAALNGVGAVLRVQPSGGAVSTNPYASGARTVVDDIYAHGIRNSFGLAIDPVTGSLWDTENGPNRMDEINQISPGFNSGWEDIMGPTSRGGSTAGLSSLGPRSFYSEPEFSWADPVAPTDLHFFNSPRLGSSYRNDLFVGDVNTGSLYHFDLNAKRNALVLGGALADGVADNLGDPLAEQGSILFGSGFGVVTDLFNGPGGLYVLSLSQGRMYRISEDPAAAMSLQAGELGVTVVPEPVQQTAVLVAIGLLLTRRT